MAPPFREVEFDILYGQGISRAADVLDLASEAGVVEKSGAWFSFQGERIGQGRDNARAYLEQHPQALDKVEALLLAKHGIQRAVATPAEEDRTKEDRTTTNHKGAASAAPAARPVPKGPAN
jgi:recombination protein RecA